MKLSDWAKEQGISYLTAWRWFKEGKLPVPATKTPSGSILVNVDPKTAPKRTIVYCRVSSNAKKDDLDRQVGRCLSFCASNGWIVDEVVKEIASGMNDERRKLTSLLKKPPFRIVVEHKDRLTRFGFGYFETLLPLLDCEIVVINRSSEERDDLMSDLVSIVTSFCCRLYGKRRGSEKAKKLKASMACTDEPVK
jgi:putative resolvase